MMANATLRNRFGMNPSYERDGNFTRRIKSFAGRVISKTSLVHDTTEPDMVTFTINDAATNFIVDVEPFERKF